MAPIRPARNAYPTPSPSPLGRQPQIHALNSTRRVRTPSPLTPAQAAVIEEMLDLKPRLSDFERSKLATDERLRVREAEVARVDYFAGDKRKRSIYERSEGQHFEPVSLEFVGWFGQAALKSSSAIIPPKSASPSTTKLFPAHRPNYRNTGSLRTLRVAQFVDDVNPPAKKARKSNTGGKWLLKSTECARFASSFDRMGYHNRGPSLPRFEATRATSKQRRDILRDDHTYLRYAPQRPLLNATKATSSMFNIINPANGKRDEAKYKILRHPSLASRIRPKGISRLGRPTNGLDVRRAPTTNLNFYRECLRSYSYTENDVIAATDTSQPTNSVVSVPSGLKASDFVTEYDHGEVLDTKQLKTRSNMAASSARISLRESVLIARELHHTSPTRHGEKAALYLDEEFLADTAIIGHLSSTSWYRSLKERSEARKWRAARHEELDALKLNAENCQQAVDEVKMELQKHLEKMDARMDTTSAADMEYAAEQEEVVRILTEDLARDKAKIISFETLMELNEPRLDDWEELRGRGETRKQTSKMLLKAPKREPPHTRL